MQALLIFGHVGRNFWGSDLPVPWQAREDKSKATDIKGWRRREDSLKEADVVRLLKCRGLETRPPEIGNYILKK